MDRACCDIAGCQVQLHPHAAGPAVHHICTASKTVLQPRHEHDVAVCIPYNHSQDRAPALVLDARVVQPGVVAASIAVPGYAPEGFVKLLNLSARPSTIPEGTYIGDAYPFWSSASLSTFTAVPPNSADQSGRLRCKWIFPVSLTICIPSHWTHQHLSACLGCVRQYAA